MEDPKPTMIAKKLDIVSLMDALTELYQAGVAYVDISGSQGEIKDALFLSFSRSYMDPEYQDQFDDIDTNTPDTIHIKQNFSDEDINLIS